MDYKLLKNKQTITKESDYDGSSTVEYLDLLDATFDRDFDVYGNPVIVEKEYVARPDLISYVAYGRDDYADVICKVNGISNPFEMNEGDVLIVPPLSFISKYFTVHTNTNISGMASDTDQITKSASSYAKKKNERRMPNEMVVGETNFVIDNSLGIVYY